METQEVNEKRKHDGRKNQRERHARMCGEKGRNEVEKSDRLRNESQV